MSDSTTISCTGCGGSVSYNPGTEQLKCPYCHNPINIESTNLPVKEQDFHAILDQLESNQTTIEILETNCKGCGAEIQTEENVTSMECPFCGSNIVVQAMSRKIIQPGALLPFKVEKAIAADFFRKWLKKRWFAPNQLKKFARLDGLNGMYTPYWTYDCSTRTHYSGMRGEHYWVSETYTTTENGKSVTKTRQVQKTRWYPASGVVNDSFDDVLIIASDSLPHKICEKLEPWDLENLVPYQDQYVPGFKVESYSIPLDQGFDQAREKMQPVIDRSIRRDIGGDEQRISRKSVEYNDISFKHILLPVWVSAYKFKDKVYRFLVNARTGEVQGERPWSWIKISLAAIAGLALIGGVILIVMMVKQ